MYLQITTKCNMTCEHCCYNCTMNGVHADWSTLVDSIAFARGHTDCISIGGGEPTMHPRFFDVLRHCLEDFDYVWLATNGSNTEAMYRLSNVIDQCDYDECDCLEEHGEEMLDEYGCLCHEKYESDSIFQEEKLSVALSLDPWHDPIDSRVVEMWTRRANQHGHSHFEIRDASKSPDGPIAQGRAATTGVGWSDGCACPDVVIQPNGKLRMCGCEIAPRIGDVWSGIDDEWQEIMDDDAYLDGRCYQETLDDDGIWLVRE